MYKLQCNSTPRYRGLCHFRTFVFLLAVVMCKHIDCMSEHSLKREVMESDFAVYRQGLGDWINSRAFIAIFGINNKVRVELGFGLG